MIELIITILLSMLIISVTYYFLLKRIEPKMSQFGPRYHLNEK